MASILLGWGFAQVAMAFFLSVFLNKSQTATIVGYAVAVWFTVVASTFNLTVYSPPNEMDWFMYFLPPFTFSRLIYLISTKCGYEHCISGFKDFNREMTWCLVNLYLWSLIYMILGWYLYQVVPQTYGVPKKWNFLWADKKRVGGSNTQAE